MSELRLAGTKTIIEANEVLACYLPGHNRKFAVPAAQSGSAFRTPTRDVDGLFCLKYPRVAGLDNVVRFVKRRLQILPDTRFSYARANVEVHEDFNGVVSVYYQGRRLETRPAPLEASKMREKTLSESAEAKPRVYPKPPPNHPWRKGYHIYFDGNKY